MPEMIDPNAAEAREMQQRQNKVQFAAQLMTSMMHGRGDAVTLLNVSPKDLFSFAIEAAEEMNKYFYAPLTEKSRIL